MIRQKLQEQSHSDITENIQNFLNNKQKQQKAPFLSPRKPYNCLRKHKKQLSDFRSIYFDQSRQCRSTQREARLSVLSNHKRRGESHSRHFSQTEQRQSHFDYGRRSITKSSPNKLYTKEIPSFSHSGRKSTAFAKAEENSMQINPSAVFQSFYLKSVNNLEDNGQRAQTARVRHYYGQKHKEITVQEFRLFEDQTQQTAVKDFSLSSQGFLKTQKKQWNCEHKEISSPWNWESKTRGFRKTEGHLHVPVRKSSQKGTQMHRYQKHQGKAQSNRTGKQKRIIPEKYFSQYSNQAQINRKSVRRDSDYAAYFMQKKPNFELHGQSPKQSKQVSRKPESNK